MDDYNYRNLPITPSIIEEIIVQLFNGSSSKRDVIVNKVLDYHISNGGRAPEAQDFPRSVKKALSNMMDKGWAANRSYGYWEINKKDAPLNTVDVEGDLVTPIEDIPTHMIYGKGEYAVYFYYFNNYRKLAELQGDLFWPCKIGRTDRDPLIRILSQASTALPEKPTIEFIIRTSDSSLLENMLHSILKMKGRHLEASPGSEWFSTNPAEVIEIINYIDRNILIL
jgi:hypothetical protein